MPRRSSLNNRQGLWIAVFGPDGAGKSAAIQRLTEELSRYFHIERFHFRPRFRWRWQISPAVTDPHGKPPRSFLLSVFKLFYWLADYWYGYVTLIRPALLHPTLVLFDRHYHDVLVDPARYRLPASTLCFANLLAQSVPRPDLYILLDVPAEVLQQRKPEVTCEESRRQRLAYLQMFQSMPNALIVDADCPLDEVTQQMKLVILDMLATRVKSRNEVSLVARA